MKKILFICLINLLFGTAVWSQEFTHFKLKDNFKLKYKKAKRLAKKNLQKLEKSGIELQGLSTLNAELLGMLAGDYENIGLSQTERLIQNHNLGGGVLNFSGFTWYKPMADYQITANREVAPDLYSDKWIVQDVFSVYVEAATLLTNLKENDMIEITDTAIGAFAGVSFTRTYHYYHYAETYFDGLTSDYSKLFLSFTKFSNPKDMLDIDEYEVLKKQDSYSYNAGAVAVAPVGSGFGLQAGVLVQKAHSKEVMIQGVGKQDNPLSDEFLRVSIKSQTDASSQAELSLQYDFFNILKLTLLSYELNYTYGKKNSSYLTFYKSDKKQILNNAAYRKEFENILKGKDEIHLWKENITASEQRHSENLSSKFNFLLLGSLKKRATEQVRIIKDGIEKVFFTNYSESVKYVQNFLSRLFSEAIKKIFDMDFAANNDTEISKKMTIEYEKIDKLKAATVKKEEQFSLRLKYHLKVNETHKWYQRKYRKIASKYTDQYSPVDSKIVKQINNKELRGPLLLQTTVEVEASGLTHFNKITTSQMTDIAIKHCDVDSREYKKGRFIKQRRRVGPRMRRVYSSSQKCALKLIERFESYKKEITDHSSINLLKFKNFMGYFFSKSEKLDDLYALFGEENIYLYGQFNAKTKSGMPFQTYFQSGQFKSLGVIEEFKRSNNIPQIVLE